MMQKIGKVRLNFTYYDGIDSYSDGDIEEELLDIVKNNEDIEETIYQSNKWPLIYHLSKQRQNILEWYDFKKEETLLEVGAGCGAISGLFAEKLSKVVAVEISKRRAIINAYRNKNNNNLEILVGNLNNMEIKEKFDYISLIGVLEYSRGFTKSNQPEIDFLKKLKMYLKPNGKIIIAIENKFGLKYWAGAKEDHTAKLFDGLQGYLDTDTIATYSKTELENMLTNTGFSNLKFYYPFPDYKMPETIYSENYLPKLGDLRILIHNYDMSRYVFFDEGIVYDQLILDKNMEKFSNSFLVIAENNEIKKGGKYGDIIRKIFGFNKKF